MPVGQHRGPADYAETDRVHLAEGGDRLFGQPVHKILAPGIAAEVLERQDREHRLRRRLSGGLVENLDVRDKLIAAAGNGDYVAILAMGVL